MQFMYVLISCLLCGLGFAALATWLMTRKGNTIRDVLTAENLKDANAIQVDILNKIKVTSNLPIVGLFLVGALVAVALPAYIAYIQLPQADSSPMLVGRIRDYLQLVDQRKGERLYAYFPEMGIKGDGNFGIPLRYTEAVQSVVFESPKTDPLTLTLRIKPLENKVEVIADAFGEKPQIIPLEGKLARLPQPLSVSRSLGPTEVVAPNQPSSQPRVDSKLFGNVPDITGVAR